MSSYLDRCTPCLAIVSPAIPSLIWCYKFLIRTPDNFLGRSKRSFWLRLVELISCSPNFVCVFVKATVFIKSSMPLVHPRFCPMFLSYPGLISVFRSPISFLVFLTPSVVWHPPEASFLNLQCDICEFTPKHKHIGEGILGFNLMRMDDHDISMTPVAISTLYRYFSVQRPRECWQSDGMHSPMTMWSVREFHLQMIFHCAVGSLSFYGLK